MSYSLQHVAGKSVLFVMAAPAEYGPHLQARMSPLMIGVGPVEAAISVTAVLTGLDAADHLPDLVVSLGSAGSKTLEQTSVYQVASVSWRDMDASAFGFEKGRTPFLDLPAEIALPLRIPGIPEARLSTGGMSFQAQPMISSMRTWWRWKPMLCYAPVSASGFR